MASIRESTRTRKGMAVLSRPKTHTRTEVDVNEGAATGPLAHRNGAVRCARFECVLRSPKKA